MIIKTEPGWVSEKNLGCGRVSGTRWTLSRRRGRRGEEDNYRSVTERTANNASVSKRRHLVSLEAAQNLDLE